MIETFTAFLFAHVLADYVLQSKYMVEHKRAPSVLLLHTAIVLITAQLCLGLVAAWPLLVLAASHLLIDMLKTYSGKSGLAPYLLDQWAHIMVLIAISLWVPGLYHTGVWATGLTQLPQLNPAILGLIPWGMALLSGLILATVAGGYAVEFLMQSHIKQNSPDAPRPDGLQPDGLPQGGKSIGLLERGLIFILILAGQIGAITFLIAAKSILRFGTVSQDRAASEYVIIGTLASFGWAVIIALATQVLLSALPPLEISLELP